MQIPDDLLNPISEDDPGGPFLRFDPLDETYTSIEEARREDPDLLKEDRKVADYDEVVRLASDALARRSKDVQLAAWLTEGLLRKEGVGGFRRGLEVTVGLLRDFWDHVNPPVEDQDDLAFRAAPLAWLAESMNLPLQMAPLNKEGHGFFQYQQSLDVPSQKAAETDSDQQKKREEAIEEGKLTPEAFEKAFTATPKAWYKRLVADLEGISTAIDELDRLGDEHFGQEAPSFARLRRSLEQIHMVADELLAKKLESDPDPPEIETEGAPAAPSPEAIAVRASGRGAQARESGLAPEPTSASDAAARVAGAARYMRAQDPRNPAPYLMLRGLRWGEIRVAGTGEVDPRLLIAPETAVRSRLKGLLLDARWKELLEQVEEVMATPYGRGWLDLQRYALTACDGLGESHGVVRGAIKGALRTLLQDLPGLVDMTLMDDSPTANRETLQWLADEGLTESGPAEPEPRAKPGRDPLEIAELRVAAGKTQEAIQLLLRAVEQEKSDRARFLRRSQAARIMVGSGHEAVALPILREMMETIDRHQLEEWEEGETVALPLALLCRCVDRLGDHSVDRESLYQRVCRLDPMQALTFQGGGSDHDGSTDAADQIDDSTGTVDSGAGAEA